ncbi:MAG: ATP-binding cassette domain-containing protein, partial [Smithellaceae bacterium]
MVKIVEVKNVTKDFGGDEIITRALRGVDLDLTAGEFTSMAGPSGSGKTTLLNIIGGLDRPTSGTVSIEGKEI